MKTTANELFTSFHAFAKHSYPTNPFLAAREAVRFVEAVQDTGDVSVAFATVGLNVNSLRSEVSDFKQNPANYLKSEVAFLKVAAKALKTADDFTRTPLSRGSQT